MHQQLKIAAKLIADGLWKEALDLLRPWTLAPETDAFQAAGGLQLVARSLQMLNRESELDAYLEEIVATHPHFPVKWAAAAAYVGANHDGALIDNAFVRGTTRGMAQRISSVERDRVRALQLMSESLRQVNTLENKRIVAEFYRDFATFWIYSREYSQSWKLQILTDLGALADYEEFSWNRGGASDSRAPVDAQGNPVFYDPPASLQDAKNDGQRWRYCLDQAMEHAPDEFAGIVLRQRAEFLQWHFGVETMREYQPLFRASSGDSGAADPNASESGIWALHTLEDDETIAKLAIGVKRFKLPEEHNPIVLYRRIIALGKPEEKQSAYAALAELYQNRRQYEKASRCWNKLLADFPLAEKNERENWREQNDQIVKNWGRFETTGSHVSGKGAQLQYLFRNGTSVRFTAREINVPELLKDIKDYIRTKPQQIDWSRIGLENLGYDLVIGGGSDGRAVSTGRAEPDRVKPDRSKYVGREVARWVQELRPAPLHFDRRVTITTPMSTAGAYLLEAEMNDGNRDFIIVWLNDSAILRKQLQGANYYYFAETQNGAPLSGAEVEFFGYRRQGNARNKIEFDIKELKKRADANGQLVLGNDDVPQNGYQWLISAGTAEKDGKPQTFAFFGFSNLWYSDATRRETLDQIRAFFISDRPVYRPNDTVEYKFWLARAKYDLPETSEFAKKEVVVSIHSPRGEKLEEALFTLDSFGGLTGTLKLPADATLGTYGFALRAASGRHPDGTMKEDGEYYGHGAMRVEEYKKPEYEVKIDSPKEPIALGETIPVTIAAKYYFGAPVIDAQVKYTVIREKHAVRWFPPGPWDWLYGPGYWWPAYDSPWYPGWRNWGISRPDQTGMPGAFHSPGPPELVAEQTVAIGPDGTVSVEIDTSFAEAMFPDDAQKYTIKAEVVDKSRRTITAEDSVLVTKKPFEVHVWVDRGYYQPNDRIEAKFQARTIQGKPVSGDAQVKVRKIRYETVDGIPVPQETEVHATALSLDETGTARLSLNAGDSGQYRISCKLSDAAGHEYEGGYIFNVYGPDSAGSGSFKFNRLELLTDQIGYAPGGELQLRVNVDRPDRTILLFLRPEYGAYAMPQIIRMKETSALVKIPITPDDMPNFFVEAICVSDGELLCETREIIVPPEKRILNVEVLPSSPSYKPGEKAKAKLRVTDWNGKAVSGQNVVGIYDKSLEYISGGSNIEEIKGFFWSWRRHHHPNTFTSLQRYFHHVPAPGQESLRFLGVFGASVADDVAEAETALVLGGFGVNPVAAPMGRGLMAGDRVMKNAAGSASSENDVLYEMAETAVDLAVPTAIADAGTFPGDDAQTKVGGETTSAFLEATVRKEFADTALWIGALETDADGIADIELDMPENLTSWKINVWSLSGGTRVGYGAAEVLTRKDLMIRMQTPGFLVEKDKAVFSAIVHNYLANEKNVRVSLECDGETIAAEEETTLARNITVAPGKDVRVDWNVRARTAADAAVVRMKALTDEESDAVENTIPVFVHGMMKLQAQSGAMKSSETVAKAEVRIPEKRRPEETTLTVRFSPTLAGAMIDALPYLVDYPYGCTEQTLNRFLPTVVTQKMLLDTGIDLKTLEQSHANLNAGELGDPERRIRQWNRGGKRDSDASGKTNPVFSADEVRRMVNEGLETLRRMQLSDGGWGWFSGHGESSSAHITAQVVRGLEHARHCDIAVDETMFRRGVQWLRTYQQEQIVQLKNAALPENSRKNLRCKTQTDALDALVYLSLMETTDASPLEAQRKSRKTGTSGGVNRDATRLPQDFKAMKDFLYRDRTKLPLYAVAMLGLAWEIEGDRSKSQMCLRMLSQYLVEDDENQTAFLDLHGYGSVSGGWRWWCWFDDAIETQAMYLKLLVRNDPKSETAAKLVKYLLNNRKHATYWNSTRDTALCVEAFAEYLGATGEMKPNLDLEILFDGEVKKTLRITPENLFQIDNTVKWSHEELTAGNHTVEFRKRGAGPLYFNTYLEYFTLEDEIAAEGSEVKVERKYYKLRRVEDAERSAVDARGQALELRTETYERVPLDGPAADSNIADSDGAGRNDEVRSGDLIEIELIVESKNDYESLMIGDFKAAGTEPVSLQSGYDGNPLGAYVEYRNERTTFFVYRLPRGKHSVTYRLRAVQPGVFSALPARIEAMYAPELKGNSREFRLGVTETP